MPLRPLCLTLALVIGLAPVAPALAQVDPLGPGQPQDPGRGVDRPPERDPDAVVAGCRSRYSELFYSGEHAKRQRAFLMMAHCIRDAAVTQAVALAGEDKREKFVAAFENIEQGFKAIYGEINEKPVRDFYPTYAEQLQDAYAEILRGVLDRRVLRPPM